MSSPMKSGIIYGKDRGAVLNGQLQTHLLILHDASKCRERTDAHSTPTPPPVQSSGSNMLNYVVTANNMFNQSVLPSKEALP